jgi:transposase InsO family protein
LVASNNQEQHKQHLRLLFERLRQYGIIINKAKCVFSKSNVKFLGYLIDSNGIQPLPEKVAVITNFKLSGTIKDLQRFLGIVNYYRRFIPHAAEAQLKLQNILSGKNKKTGAKILWTEELKRAFDTCKQTLANATLLVHPTSGAPLALYVDSSDFSVGGVLEQLVKGKWQPLAFFSTKLDATQQRYSTYDRELLAAYLSIRYFRHMLEGREFVLFTDHKPLTFAFKQKSEKASPRQLRHLDYIGQFTTNVQHISGKANIVADTLSRIQEVIIPKPVNYEAVAEAQENDEELKSLLMTSTDSNLHFKKISIPDSNKQMYCDVSTGVIRPYIPSKFRRQVFESIHNLSHSGIKATTKLLRTKFIWPSINRDSVLWTRTCIQCQKSKIGKHTRSLVSTLPTPNERFKTVHIDIVGPLPCSKGYKYLLTCIDRFTRWTEAIPLEDIKAETVVQAFLSSWIARFGVPAEIKHDQGTQFESSLFKEVAKIFGTKTSHTTAYHPQSNGAIECWHRPLKAAIMCHATPQWIETLPLILLGFRSVLQEDLGTSTSELVYGDTLRLPGEFLADLKSEVSQSVFAENLKTKMQLLRPVAAAHHGRSNVFIHKALATCSHVFLRHDAVSRSLQHSYDGPYRVISRNEKTFTIQIKNSAKVVSVDRVKPGFLLKDYVITQGGAMQ